MNKEESIKSIETILKEIKKDNIDIQSINIEPTIISEDNNGNRIIQYQMFIKLYYKNLQIIKRGNKYSIPIVRQK